MGSRSSEASALPAFQTRSLPPLPLWAAQSELNSAPISSSSSNQLKLGSNQLISRNSSIHALELFILCEVQCRVIWTCYNSLVPVVDCYLKAISVSQLASDWSEEEQRFSWQPVTQLDRWCWESLAGSFPGGEMESSVGGRAQRGALLSWAQRGALTQVQLWQFVTCKRAQNRARVVYWAPKTSEMLEKGFSATVDKSADVFGGGWIWDLTDNLLVVGRHHEK